MGVTGLWSLIDASGKPVPLDTLENKVLAVDISIWLHQVVKGYQDNKGNVLPNAHLLGLFNRLCKLLYYRVKPVFIFDGKVPYLKIETIKKRNEGKKKLQNEANRIQRLIMESLAKEKIVQQALGQSATEKLISPSKAKIDRSQEDKDMMFKLPPIAENKLQTNDEKEEEEDDEEEDLDNRRKRQFYLDIYNIDINSTNFKNLPADVRLDILTDVKETRKQSSWGRIHEMPTEGDNFSKYQMQRLLKRRQVQQSFEDAGKEIGGKCFTLAELESLLSEDGIIDVAEKHSRQIASDENARVMLVRNVAKAISIKKEEKVKTETEPEAAGNDELGEEYDEDLQKAIQMSLQEPDANEFGGPSNVSPQKVADVIDFKIKGPFFEAFIAGVDPNDIKLNAEQRKKFGSAIKTDQLRTYMMENAGMNDDDIRDLINCTQSQKDEKIRNAMAGILDDYVLYGSPATSKTAPDDKIAEENEEEEEETVPEVGIMSDSDDECEILDTKDTNSKDLFSSNDTIEYDVASAMENKETCVISSNEVEEPADNDVEIQYNEVPAIEIMDSDENEVSEDDERIPKDIKLEPETITEKLVESQELFHFVDEPEKEEIPKQTYDIIDLDQMEEKTIQKSPEKKDNSVSSETTPKRKKDIRDFIQITPVKSAEKPKVEEEVVPKVASPFFVKRTPSSKKKETELKEILAEVKEKIRVSKSLFQENPLDPEEEIRKAAEELKEKKTENELKDMASMLDKEQKELEKQRNRQDRMGMSITEKMASECKDLLRLFGIPYVESPMEAEAQAAFLNEIGLTDGTITDDSDIWLFGGKTVYKNVFQQKKVVTEFRMERIEEMFKLNREKLIQLALLVGSDYTTGVQGIGAVTALEILAAFPRTEETDDTNKYMSLLSSLRKFREWFRDGRGAGVGGRIVLKNKLKNIELNEIFPNPKVAQAYLEPIIDKSAEPFTWGAIDKESIYEFARNNMGWTRLKTDEILQPVLKRLNDKRQAAITDYFNKQAAKKEYDRSKLSARVQKAVERMSGKPEEDEEQKKKEEKKKRPTKRKKGTVEKVEEEKDKEQVIVLSEESEEESKPVQLDQPSTSSGIVEKTSKQTKKKKTEEEVAPKAEKKPRKPAQKSKPKEQMNFMDKIRESDKPKRPKRTKDADPEEPPIKSPKLDSSIQKEKVYRLPDPKAPIPQKEKDKLEQELKKQKAIELFKKSSSTKLKKK